MCSELTCHVTLHGLSRKLRRMFFRKVFFWQFLFYGAIYFVKNHTIPFVILQDSMNSFANGFSLQIIRCLSWISKNDYILAVNPIPCYSWCTGSWPNGSKRYYLEPSGALNNGEDESVSRYLIWQRFNKIHRNHLKWFHSRRGWMTRSFDLDSRAWLCEARTLHCTLYTSRASYFTCIAPLQEMRYMILRSYILENQ